MVGTRWITYEGSGPLVRVLVELLEEEGVAVRVRREAPPVSEYGDARGMSESVVATLVPTGAPEAIKAGVQRFRQRFPGRGVIKIDGEDDPPSSCGRHRA
jgi:hypothetical protein